MNLCLSEVSNQKNTVFPSLEEAFSNSRADRHSPGRLALALAGGTETRETPRSEFQTAGGWGGGVPGILSSVPGGSLTIIQAK